MRRLVAANTRLMTRALALALPLVLLPGTARAEELPPLVPSFDFETFHAATDPRAISVIDGARPLEKGSYSTGLIFHYSDRPLGLCLMKEPGAECVPAGTAVSSRVRADLTAAFGFGLIEARLHLPMVITQTTPIDPPMDVPRLAGSGVGDITPGVRVRLYDSGLIAIAAGADLSIPTGQGAASFVGNETFLLTPRVVADLRRPHFALAASLGYRFRPEPAVLANITLDDQVTFALAAEYEALRGLGIGAAVYGAVGVVGANTNPGAMPIELALSARLRATDSVSIEIGGGPGLAPGVGTPEFRLFAGLRYGNVLIDEDHDGVADIDDRCPGEREDVDGFEDSDGCIDPDNDGDGINDALDKCRDKAEDVDQFQDEDGCPDTDDDGDGALDVEDKCPRVAEDFDGFADEDGCPELDDDEDGIADKDDKCQFEAEDKDGLADEDGCPEADFDGDGVLDPDDKCPTEAEDKDGFRDEDGCPDPDNDGDNIADAQDKCPLEAETYNGNLDEDGCPDKGRVLVVVSDVEIGLTEKIFFGFNSHVIDPRSFKLLNTVATAIKANADMKIRVEGHTDDVGDEAFNLELSHKRADSVRAFLTGKAGVPAERVESIGYGKTRRLIDAETPDARAANRRVEFKIVSGKTALPAGATLPAGAKQP